MSLTLDQIKDDIVGIASSGSNPDNFKIPDEQIYYWINQIRAMLIGQSLAKKDDINDTWLQQINCLELELVDESECCLVDTDCYILRTVRQIPNTIDTWKNNWIVNVTTPTGTEISKSNQFANKYQKYSKYTGSKRWYYLKNNYIYIVNDTLLEYINIQGLFENPEDLSSFVSCENESCFNANTSPYPISANMSSQITDIILKTKIAPFLLQFKPDDRNDGANIMQEIKK